MQTRIDISSQGHTRAEGCRDWPGAWDAKDPGAKQPEAARSSRGRDSRA
jgi:hypothetical protein